MKVKKLSIVILVPLIVIGIALVVIFSMRIKSEVASGKGVQYPGLFGGDSKPLSSYSSLDLENATNEELAAELDSSDVDDGEEDLDELDSQINSL